MFLRMTSVRLTPIVGLEQYLPKVKCRNLLQLIIQLADR